MEGSSIRLKITKESTLKNTLSVLIKILHFDNNNKNDNKKGYTFSV